jgi:hypothetical protein
VRRYGPDDVVLLNHDIHARVEDADVKRFGREMSEVLGVPITQANHASWDTMDQFDVVMEAGAFKGANGHVLCTHRLKSEPFDRWLDVHCPPGTATLYYGFDASETDRIQRRASILGARGYATDFPLATWRRTIHSTAEIGVAPPLTYSAWKHANCAGCLKAGRQHWYVVYCTRPDLWARAKYAEDFIGYTIIDGTSLAELEPLFAEMQRAGIVPTEHVPHQRFWADAKRLVRKRAAIDAEAAAPARPCDCSYFPKRKPLAADPPPCTCGALAHGVPHGLACERGAFGAEMRAA